VNEHPNADRPCLPRHGPIQSAAASSPTGTQALEIALNQLKSAYDSLG
jgi:hypothetical protein